MKPPPLRCHWAAHLLVAGVLLLSGRAFAWDRIHIPPPPPPEKVVRDIRSFFHRLADGVKDASKQTWNAVRDRFHEEDEDAPPPRGKRQMGPPRGGDQSRENLDSFARSKEAVPYRYDDADRFDAPAGPLPKVNIVPRDTAKSGPYATPKEQEKAGQPDDVSRKPFMTPEFDAPDTRPAPLEGQGITPPPKATVPPEDAKIEFARPVPGKRGLVYPPGAGAGDDNMVDVSGFETGQIVRDPRSGKLFRVP